MKNFSRGNSFRGNDRREERREDRQMYRATCEKCERDCEVPFRPSGGKPVYCSNCFKREQNPREEYRERSERPERSGRQGRSERPEMFRATCDECRKSCEVPFRPSGDKPVYCSNCFGKGNGPSRDISSKSGGRSFDSNKGEGKHEAKHAEINAKLDKILALLQHITPSKEIIIKKPKTTVNPPKEENTPKKTQKVSVKVKGAKVKEAKKVAKKATPKKATPKKVTTKKATPKKVAKKATTL